MPDEQPPDPPARGNRRVGGLTPEQRRFMGTPRLRDEPAEVKEEPAEEVAPTPELSAEEPKADSPAVEPIQEREADDEHPDEETREIAPARERERKRTIGGVRTNTPAARHSEMQTPLLLLGAVIILFAVFFAGKKFDSLKNALFSSRTTQKEPDGFQDKYPGLSADELVVQALMSEKRGDRQDAADRFVAAKHKNLGYRGILFRVGKLAYDAGDFDGADKLFERAIAFCEDPATANYFRGLIAVRHSDLAAAQRFFETAATDDPFTAQYHYYLAEALRIDHHPNESIPRYERARLLAVSEQEAVLAQFKIRMAQIEAGDAPKVAAEMAEKKSAAEMPVDWAMTAAALNIIQGQVDDALPLIAHARAAQQPGLFTSCVEDLFFVNAAAKNPAVATALQSSPDTAPAVP
jgi:tetratricopeptide (TPR) repeat protein